MAVLFGLLASLAGGTPSSVVISVVIATALLALVALHVVLPQPAAQAGVGPHRARAPDVILPSTHPDAAGHSRPRAPGATAVAPA
ncbi:hypothetical protein EFY87_13695 [Flexivirga caeni]|uniref:Uncharacterized protein n=2 Tax=Flexivirga caeni TaxID=2294115 RepID=A0A3M9M878_9MICO|nr:hypothetical protein EFY87_13695 [Flexivirga caeni]